MAITAYVGLPGHGKSYGVVDNVIAPAIKAGRRVWTNIPCNEDVWLERFGCVPTRFQTQDVVDDADWFDGVFEAGAILVIDELWRLWPSGLKASDVSEQHKSFLAEHRHRVGADGFSTDVVFVTQDLAQIAAFARQLVETTYRVVKPVSLGIKNKYRVDSYFGAVTGANPPVSKRESDSHGLFKSEVFALYKSHTMSGHGAGTEATVDDRNNLFKAWWFKAGVAVILVGAILAYQGMTSVVDKYSAGDVVATSPPVPAAPVQNLPVVPRKIVPPLPPPKPPFLSSARSLVISAAIGNQSNVLYRIKINFDDTSATLDLEQLRALGYVIEPVAQCLLQVTGADFAGFIACAGVDRSAGLFEARTDANVQRSL